MKKIKRVSIALKKVDTSNVPNGTSIRATQQDDGVLVQFIIDKVLINETTIVVRKNMPIDQIVTLLSNFVAGTVSFYESSRKQATNAPDIPADEPDDPNGAQDCPDSEQPTEVDINNLFNKHISNILHKPLTSSRATQLERYINFRNQYLELPCNI